MRAAQGCPLRRKAAGPWPASTHGSRPAPPWTACGKGSWAGRPSGSQAPGQGASDSLSLPLSLQKAQTCALPSSLSRAVLVISSLQFQLHHLSITSPGAPADRVSTFLSCRQASGVRCPAGPVGSGSQCVSGPPATPRREKTQAGSHWHARPGSFGSRASISLTHGAGKLTPTEQRRWPPLSKDRTQECGI